MAIEMKSTRDEVYAAIDQERRYQRKWESPTTVTTSGGVHSNLEFLVYIRSYVNEALETASRCGDPDAEIACQNNLRKIAALAVAAMEQNGARRRA